MDIIKNQLETARKKFIFVLQNQQDQSTAQEEAESFLSESMTLMAKAVIEDIPDEMSDGYRELTGKSLKAHLINKYLI